MNEKKEYEEYFLKNKMHWNSKAKSHFDSDYYDVESFKKDPHKLSFVADEYTELGDVKGKKILHLMCHFGLDTLSFARLGAEPTGVDISDEAIAFAKELNKELDLGVKFIHANVYELEDRLDGQFDIVFMSVGVLCWLPDLEELAKIVHHFLKPEGLFYIKDGHPFKNIFEYDSIQGLYPRYPYFENKTYRWEEDGSYANPEAKLEYKENFQWDHTLSSILNSLIQAGLRIEKMQEYEYIGDQRFPFMVEREPGKWVFPGKYEKLIPWSFSIKARRDK